MPEGPVSLGEQYAAAARILARVLCGESLAHAREPVFRSIAQPRVRAGAQSFLYAALRAYGVAPALLELLLHRPVSDKVLLALLHLALVDLRANPSHAHTLVDQAVHAAGLLGRGPARGLVNAVLRNYLRHRERLEARLDERLEARLQYPGWWIRRLRAAYPDQWQAILAAGNAPPPFTIRVNRRAVGLADYAAQLAAAGLSARPVGPDALRVEPAPAVSALPGFDAGLCSVQDAGAQLAAGLLDPQEGQRVLDACAAPGGKSAHILECAAVRLTALDIDPERSLRTGQTLERLGLRAQVLSGDASRPDLWWDARPYDRILADVPCSASGVVRRHPDIKWLRRESDIAAFARTQRAILQALWSVLARGGKLLYATCSVFPEENQAVVEAFCERHRDARRLPIDGKPGQAPVAGQLLPAEDHDGFFYALLEKSA